MTMAGDAAAAAGSSASAALEWQGVFLHASTAAGPKRILSDVSGAAPVGQVLGLMGPSGAGKSVLLDCLAHRNRAYEGSVTYYGEPWSSASLRHMSYVVQRDLFHETITVREHLVFQARLRLGGALHASDIACRVDAVLADLGLSKCRNALIGGARIRGISGGERKRLSLATAMLAEPRVLLVDEPTSGLDSHSAVTVVHHLQRIARDGRVVITTLHQPSPEIMSLLDRVHLLADGGTIFDGAPADLPVHFTKLGYARPPFVPPIEFVMSLLVEDDGAVNSNDDDEDDCSLRVDALKQSWIEHRHEYTPSRHTLASHGDWLANTAKQDPVPVGFLQQFWLLAHRNALRIVRDSVTSRAALLQTLFIAFLVGAVYFGLKVSQQNIQAIVGLLFFISINQTLISAKPVFASVPAELALLRREYNDGLFRVDAWYLAKNVTELVLQVLLPIFYFVPQYLLVGVADGGVREFFTMQGFVILVSSASVGYGYMISCACGRADIAVIVGVAFLLPFILFGGLFLNAADVPGYLRWWMRLSPVRYCFEGLMHTFWSRVPTIACDGAACIATTGAQVLDHYGVSDRSPVLDAALLVVLNVGFRLVGMVALALQLRRRS
ncbi:hypothetical protein PINS_up015711 [Pythium insidiosum]|nr:hypothetical protein PINS_up015711 [Pythium insidiosum]